MRNPASRISRLKPIPSRPAKWGRRRPRRPAFASRSPARFCDCRTPHVASRDAGGQTFSGDCGRPLAVGPHRLRTDSRERAGCPCGVTDHGARSVPERDADPEREPAAHPDGHAEPGSVGESQRHTQRVEGAQPDQEAGSRAEPAEIRTAEVRTAESAPQKSAPQKSAPQKSPGGKRVVYLTFDDGPSAYTDEVLDILTDYGAKATFFVIGENVGDDPSAVQALRRAGMSVQNHTWGHPDLSTLSSGEIRSQVSRTDRAIQAAGGGASTCVRPPYGASSSRVRSVLRDMGKQQMLWTIDTLDWQRPGANRIYRRVVDSVEPGSIVLAHDGGGTREQTVAALPRILATLKDAGYRFRTLCS